MMKRSAFATAVELQHTLARVSRLSAKLSARLATEAMNAQARTSSDQSAPRVWYARGRCNALHYQTVAGHTPGALPCADCYLVAAIEVPS